MNWKVFTPILALVLFLLAGCSDQSIRRSAIKVPVMSDWDSTELAKQIREDKQGVVFVYRDLSLGGAALPCIVAVDGRIVGRLAVETYLRLTLDPGKHTVSLFPDVTKAPFAPGHKGFKVVREMPIEIEEGNVQYLRCGLHLNYFTFTEGFDPVAVDNEVGAQAVSIYKHALFDLENQTLNNYLASLPTFAKEASIKRQAEKEDERRRAEYERNQRQASSNVSNGSSSFESLLEGLAAVFLIGLVVAGAAYGHSVPMYVPPSRPYNPPAMIQQIDTDRAGSYNFSGDRIIGGAKQEEWQIRGRKLIGSNGTEYTINSAGTRIYGNNGQSYQFSQSGRRIDGSDGSYCEYVGVNRTLKCSAPR
jgi:hypothetical protein